jgi:PEGA domain
VQKLTVSMIVSLLISFLVYSGNVHSGLIEPTRTLQTASDDLGTLNVFSEPPNLEIWLDGKVVGKTPLTAVELSSGTHVLRIEGSEAKIFISARKATSLSWFKGSFIEILEKTKSAGEPTTVSKKKEITPSQTGNAAGKESAPNDPFYWPLNPRGPIY